MSYLSETLSGAQLKHVGRQPAPFGPGFLDEQLDQAERMEVWHSRLSDPAEEWIEFRLFDKQGECVGRSRQMGG